MRSYTNAHHLLETMLPFYAHGPQEQTPAQRQALVDRAATRLGRQPGTLVYGLCQRYVAGELSLDQVIAIVEDLFRNRYPGHP